MKVYITASKVTVTMDVTQPVLADFLSNGNRQIMRQRIREQFESLFGKGINKVRFEDECPKCGAVKETDKNIGFSVHCHTRGCEHGFPDVADLRRLMNAMPNDPKEASGPYLDRIKAAWNAEKADE